MCAWKTSVSMRRKWATLSPSACRRVSPNCWTMASPRPWKEHLDEVAQGKLEWRELLDQFYAEFSGLLEKAGEPEPAGMQPNEPTMTDIECSNCGRPMQVRTASTGVFLGCSGYALPPKERCKKTINLTPGDEAIREDADDEAESRLLRTKHRCKLVQHRHGQLPDR